MKNNVKSRLAYLIISSTKDLIVLNITFYYRFFISVTGT